MYNSLYTIALLSLESGTVCDRDLDCDKSRQEMVRNLVNFDQQKNVKEQSNKCICS